MFEWFTLYVFITYNEINMFCALQWQEGALPLTCMQNIVVFVVNNTLRIQIF